MSGLNPVTIILIVNSLSVVSLVITQNETAKEDLSKRSSSSNPLELVLWFTIILELILLLIQTKVSDF
jgi:heme/copper-type cytochrome/quinol oxidase subunit 2|tara:strand:- start:64 stop:267 length:204 start_codon:yes stop_codon:yes gene_type:complete